MRGEIGHDAEVLSGVVVQARAGLDLVGCWTSAEDRVRALDGLGRWLTERGYVLPEFTGALLAREVEFPTGLETPDGGVALAHTDASMVVRPTVMVCRPTRPIPFRRMDQSDAEVGVGIIILLALSSGSGHLDVLRQIALLLSDDGLRPSILAQASPAEALEAISSTLEDLPAPAT